MSLPGPSIPLFKIKVQEKGKIKDIKLEVIIAVGHALRSSGTCHTDRLRQFAVLT